LIQFLRQLRGLSHELWRVRHAGRKRTGRGEGGIYHQLVIREFFFLRSFGGVDLDIVLETLECGGMNQLRWERGPGSAYSDMSIKLFFQSGHVV
jgi:hypothetical protein